MDISYVKKIIKLVEHSTIDELELEEEGTKIKVSRHRNSVVSVQPVGTAPLAVLHQESIPSVQNIELARLARPTTPVESQYHEVHSPIVGTFYRAPAPDADPYVEVGQIVKVGTVLCIVEAMKLMNEIESDCEGKIVKIMAENGKAVEYNQVLFLIEKS